MILITGINGFIAKNLYNRLKYENNIIGTTKEESENIVDILNKNTPSIIIHSGAELYDNNKMFESNIILTYNILEYCKNATNLKRLVIIGSSSEYGKKNESMKETDCLTPQTIYAGTKCACTMLACSYSHSYNIPIFIIRPFTVYGINEKSNKFLQILFNKIRTKDFNISISQGNHDYIYIDDFIEALISIIYNNDNKFDIINIGSGTQISNHKVVEIFETVTNHKFTRIDSLESKWCDSNCWVSDNSKLLNYYTPKINLEIGMRKIYEYHSKMNI